MACGGGLQGLSVAIQASLGLLDRVMLKRWNVLLHPVCVNHASWRLHSQHYKVIRVVNLKISMSIIGLLLVLALKLGDLLHDHLVDLRTFVALSGVHFI